MLHENESIVITSIEIWTTIATEDAELGQNSIQLIHPISKNLIIVLLQNLLKPTENSYDDGSLKFKIIKR